MTPPVDSRASSAPTELERLRQELREQLLRLQSLESRFARLTALRDASDSSDAEDRTARSQSTIRAEASLAQLKLNTAHNQVDRLRYWIDVLQRQ